MPYSDHVFADLYGNAGVIVAVMPAGIAVRGCAPHLSDKWHDPAVVVVTPDLRDAFRCSAVITGEMSAPGALRRLILSR